jgi:hypothetical protein
MKVPRSATCLAISSLQWTAAACSSSDLSWRDTSVAQSPGGGGSNGEGGRGATTARGGGGTGGEGVGSEGSGASTAGVAAEGSKGGAGASGELGSAEGGAGGAGENAGGQAVSGSGGASMSGTSGTSGTSGAEGCSPGCCEVAPPSEVVSGDVVLADSSRGFSGTQGECGWSYGYLPSGDEPFTLLPLFVDSASPVWQASSTQPPWSSIYREVQHPNLIPLQWIARRWTSHVSGLISVRGHVAKRGDAIGGDGIIAQVRVDGQTLWEGAVAFDDVVGRDFEVEATVVEGTTVDLVVAPKAGDGHDSTTLVASISW